MLLQRVEHADRLCPVCEWDRHDKDAVFKLAKFALDPARAACV
jgi:hypothetical protein